MPRRLLLLTALGVALTLPASPAVAGECAGADSEVTALAIEPARAAVLCLVNNERAARGLNALTADSRLELAAQRHTDDMVVRDFFDHRNLAALDPFDRMEQAGYGFASAGENIAAGQPTAREAMEGWMASTGHCQNILGDRFTQIGIGVHPRAATIGTGTGTWTQNLGRPAGQPAPANPNGVAAACPVVGGLATPATASTALPGGPAGGTGPATPPAGSGGEAAGTGEARAAALAAGDAATAGMPKRLTAQLRRGARRIAVSGRLAAADGTRVRVVVRRAGRTVRSRSVRLRDGRYRVRVRTRSRAGRLRVVVRAAGQRASRTSRGR